MKNIKEEQFLCSDSIHKDIADKAYNRGFKEAKEWDNKMVLKAREYARQELKEELIKFIDDNKFYATYDISKGYVVEEVELSKLIKEK